MKNRNLAGKKIVFVLTAFWLTGLCGKLNAQDAETEKDSFAEILKVEAKGLSEDGIEEILRIRQQLGGGTGLEHEATSDWSSGLTSSTPAIQETRSPPKIKIHDSKLPAVARVSKPRSAARRLDDLAADLEDIEMYPEADELRAMAAKLRQQVRRFTRSRSVRQLENSGRDQ